MPDPTTVAVNELRAEMQRSEQRLREEARHREQMLLDTIDELRAQVQQSDQTLAALANHTHDANGRTLFQVLPSACKRRGSVGLMGRGGAVPSSVV